MAEHVQYIQDFAELLKADWQVSIYIGDDEEPHFVPKSLLVLASDYFIDALNGEERIVTGHHVDNVDNVSDGYRVSNRLRSLNGMGTNNGAPLTNGVYPTPGTHMANGVHPSNQIHLTNGVHSSHEIHMTNGVHPNGATHLTNGVHHNNGTLMTNGVHFSNQVQPVNETPMTDGAHIDLDQHMTNVRLTALRERAMNRARMTLRRRELSRVPNDKYFTGAWQLLLFWVFNKRLPHADYLIFGDDEDLQALLGRAWLLGDQYGTPEFQDLVMLELLLLFEDSPIGRDALLQSLRRSPPDSPLRKLLAEEAVIAMYGKSKSLEFTEGDLAELAEAPDMRYALQNALVMLTDDRTGEVCERIEPRLRDHSEIWKEFMVAGGPKNHWARGEDTT